MNFLNENYVAHARSPDTCCSRSIGRSAGHGAAASPQSPGPSLDPQRSGPPFGPSGPPGHLLEHPPLADVSAAAAEPPPDVAAATQTALAAPTTESAAKSRSLQTGNRYREQVRGGKIDQGRVGVIKGTDYSR